MSRFILVALASSILVGAALACPTRAITLTYEEGKECNIYVPNGFDQEDQKRLEEGLAFCGLAFDTILVEDNEEEFERLVTIDFSVYEPILIMVTPGKTRAQSALDQSTLALDSATERKIDGGCH